MKELKTFWQKSQDDLIFTQATALAYTTLVSLVPLLAVAFFLFKAFGGFHTLQQELQPLIEANLAPAFGDKIIGYLDDVVEKVHAGAVGTLGILGFMITSIMTLTTIEKSFNFIWGIKKPRPLSKRITVYWTLMTLGPLLMALSIMFGLKALSWLQNDHGAIADVFIFLFRLIPYIASGLLFSAVFYFIPNVQVHSKAAFQAGIITGIVFELAKLLYSNYAKHAIANNAIYGAMAVIPVFLLWLYLIWLIILFGAELCFHLDSKKS